MKRKILLIATVLSIGFGFSSVLLTNAAVPCHDVSCGGALITSKEQRVVYSSEFDCSEHPFCKKQYEYLTIWQVVRCNRCGAIDQEEQIQVIDIKENHRSLK